MIDPVCGMEVTPQDAAGSYQYQGQQYYFCNKSCLERFRADPGAFLRCSPDHHATPAADTNGIYTCPMHPEVRQQGPRRVSQVRHGAGTSDGHG